MDVPLPQETAKPLVAAQVEQCKGIFSRLMDPHEDPHFVQQLISRTNQLLMKEISGKANSQLGSLCISTTARMQLEAGLIRTMITVARQDWSGLHVPKERYMAQYWALEVLRSVVRSGSDPERQKLRDEMLEEGIVELCLKHLQHPLCIMREVVIDLLHTLACNAFLGDKLSSSMFAEILEGVCLYTLSGSEHLVSQMLDPETTWQSLIIPHASSEMPMDMAARFAPLCYSMAQKNAVGAAHALMGAFRPDIQNFCHQILKQKPRIIDLLLDCAVLDRYPGNPEIHIGMTACEILAFFLQWPCHIVPGVPSSVDQAFKKGEWKAMLQIMAIFTSRSDWSEKLIEVWMQIQEEDMTLIQSYVENIAGHEPTELSLPQAFQTMKTIYGGRGIIRILVLRLISTLTHAAESCGITNAQIESFLHIAYHACLKGKSLDEFTSHQEELEATEYCAERFFYPTNGGNMAGAAFESPFAVEPQCILGPTALIRLLVVLAQRKAFSGIQTVKKAPAGISSSTSLNQIQQITHPDIIRRAIKISQSRILDRVERGRQRTREKKDRIDDSLACSLFASSAELATALVALDTHTEGVYAAEALGARKQLIIALGNASQMALNLGNSRRALYYALGAVNAAKDIPAEEGLDPAIAEKNLRRVHQAYGGLMHS